MTQQEVCLRLPNRFHFRYINGKWARSRSQRDLVTAIPKLTKLFLLQICWSRDGWSSGKRFYKRREFFCGSKHVSISRFAHVYCFLNLIHWMFLHDGFSGMCRIKEGVGTWGRLILQSFDVTLWFFKHNTCIIMCQDEFHFWWDFLHPLFNSKCERSQHANHSCAMLRYTQLCFQWTISTCILPVIKWCMKAFLFWSFPLI